MPLIEIIIKIMISRSVFCLNDSAPLSGQRILAVKVPQLGAKLFTRRKTPTKLTLLPLHKSRASEILTCFKPPESNRFKYSRLSYDYSASPKKQKNFLLKPLAKSFELNIKKNVKDKNAELLVDRAKKKEKNQRITIFDKGPNDLSFRYLENGENSESDESIYLEKKLAGNKIN